MYRQGIKSALSVRESVNNEIVYLESGEFPLEIRISAAQLKFWVSICTLQQENPEHYISKLVQIADNTNYVKHYKNLLHQHIYPTSCISTMKKETFDTFTRKIQEAARNDPDSKLGSYFLVNPQFVTPSLTNKLEFQRICITRYRTGSHNLRVERDRRLPYSNREDRICSCNMGIQTVQHVLLYCPLLNCIREKYGIVDVANGINCDGFLLEMECALSIK